MKDAITLLDESIAMLHRFKRSQAMEYRFARAISMSAGYQIQLLHDAISARDTAKALSRARQELLKKEVGF